PTARVEEPALSGAPRQRKGNGKEFESDQGGHRREPAVGSRLGAGPKWNVHFHPQGQESGEEGKVRFVRAAFSRADTRRKKIERRKQIMPVVDVVNLDGKKVGQVELADTVFGAEVNKHLLHEASRWYLAGRRR